MSNVFVASACCNIILPSDENTEIFFNGSEKIAVSDAGLGNIVTCRSRSLPTGIVDNFSAENFTAHTLLSSFFVL